MAYAFPVEGIPLLVGWNHSPGGDKNKQDALVFGVTTSSGASVNLNYGWKLGGTLYPTPWNGEKASIWKR